MSCWVACGRGRFPLNFDLSRHNGIEDFRRQWHVVLLPFVKEIKRVRHLAGVEALLHQRRLQVLERSRDVQGALQPQARRGKGGEVTARRRRPTSGGRVVALTCTLTNRGLA